MIKSLITFGNFFFASRLVYMEFSLNFLDKLILNSKNLLFRELTAFTEVHKKKFKKS